MSYTKLKTWANGDIILAADVQGELDNVRSYIAQMTSNEVESSRWVDTKHVMRGDYNAVTNQAQFVSGLYAGQKTLFDTGFTYGTTYNTRRVGSGAWEYMPLTSLTLEVRRPMSALMTWWSTPITYDNQSAGAQGETEIRLYIGNKSLRYGEPCKSLEELGTLTAPAESRYFLSGFHMVDYNSMGIYEIGLATQSTTSKTRLHSWGISFEAFNL